MNKEYLKLYGFLGIGQFGSNVTKKFEEVGYPCVVANSSTEDLMTREAKNKLHFKNGQGCHKDRRKSKQLLKDNLKQLIDEVKTKMPSITTIFICASAAGGTGSGMLAAVAKILAGELKINICLVTVLPDNSESYQAFANTVELFKEIEQLDCIGAVFILDNAKNKDKLKINDIFYTHLHSILTNENGGNYGCLDRSEIDKLLSIPGRAVIAKVKRENRDKLISALVSSNIYAPIEQNKVIRYVGYLGCGTNADISDLFLEVGTPIDTYIGTNAPSYTCMLTGLSLPRTRLTEIMGLAKNNVEIIQNNIKSVGEFLFDDSLDFLTVFEEKPHKKQEKELTSLDILNEFL